MELTAAHSACMYERIFNHCARHSAAVPHILKIYKCALPPIQPPYPLKLLCAPVIRCCLYESALYLL